MDVLDALEATAHLADETAPRTVDAVLVALGRLADPGTIELDVDPRPGRHGSAAVLWRQDGRKRSTEGHTLDVASRRALRAAEAVSAQATARG